MSELTARLAARTRALGLVAATAAVTTALAGGGVVAVTAVGNEKPIAAPGEQRSATATATIGSRPGKPAKPPAPACGAASNHGGYVSGVAKSAAPGPSHGPRVAAAATSDCGKKAGPARAGKPAKPGRSGKG